MWLTVCAVAAAGGCWVSVASAGFSGALCSVLSAKQVSNAGVTPLKCRASAPVKTPYATTYIGYWGSSANAPTHLIIQINKVSNAGSLSTFKALMAKRRGWVATPAKVAGVGSIAYEARTNDIGEIQFITGSYFVGLTLYSKSPARVTALAKAVATKL
ncbi:MAG TPA: hypothetical protein VLJ44_01875 [Gaiellaceae bacterium]|nr:hypothetical protein [Gaiellaceae bacterium]